MSADEKRKLLDYGKRKFEIENRPVNLMVVAKGFNEPKIDEFLKLKDEMERYGYGWLYVIKYADILNLIPEKTIKC